MSLWTYDTAYYTGRSATWPIPWGQPVSLTPIFEERDPGRLLAELRRRRIDYLLVPTYIRPVAFDGANYPESLQNGLEALQGSGAIEVVWQSRELLLIRCGER